MNAKSLWDILPLIFTIYLLLTGVIVTVFYKVE